jgi:hypothetical protein
MTSGTYDLWNVWHIYSVAVNQVMVTTVKHSKWWLHLNLLAATLYQGNPDRNHKLWYIVLTERSLFVFLYFFFCPSIYEFLLPLWYLQTLHTTYTSAAGMWLHIIFVGSRLSFFFWWQSKHVNMPIPVPHFTIVLFSPSFLFLSLLYQMLHVGLKYLSDLVISTEGKIW